ncbi:endonuclease domain-containing protein [Sphingomonas sp. CARO-RG-8B-R24-01]|uniref:endonuclease domain-containing protein n=1 Tax=Sphingomonas sp. CARO-RG-8B-R24-01 TaxID=2914831 RepID=UPI001F59543B|nr:endonuclease domain-containing protein [Sphingomonas sp. CARO-RG-8B-R24-01]
MIRGTTEAFHRSRASRWKLTLPEVLLWQQLRKRGTGHKWRRQQPAGVYSLDFYCHAARLCVEVDGEAHSRGDRPQRDARRDSWVQAQGIVTLRIPAIDILRDLDAVLRGIVAYATERAPVHPPSRDEPGEE